MRKLCLIFFILITACARAGPTYTFDIDSSRPPRANGILENYESEDCLQSGQNCATRNFAISFDEPSFKPNLLAWGVGTNPLYNPLNSTQSSSGSDSNYWQAGKNGTTFSVAPANAAYSKNKNGQNNNAWQNGFTRLELNDPDIGKVAHAPAPGAVLLAGLGLVTVNWLRRRKTL